MLNEPVFYKQEIDAEQGPVASRAQKPFCPSFLKSMENSSLHDLLCVPKGRTIINQGRGSNKTNWARGSSILGYRPPRILAVVQLLGRVWLFVTPWTEACKASLPFSISQSFLKLMPIESVTPSNHLILYCPLLLLSSIYPSTRVFPNELTVHIRWLKCWSFSISPSNEYSGLKPRILCTP